MFDINHYVQMDIIPNVRLSKHLPPNQQENDQIHFEERKNLSDLLRIHIEKQN